jgi:hypothetical protein
MFTKLYKLLAGAAITAMILAMAAVPAFAADQPATSRDAAGAPMSGVVGIGPGATQWYKFNYHYDNSKKDNEPTEALVVLKMSVPGAVSFSIETPASLALPKEDKDGHLRGPVGAGAPMSLKIHNHDGTEASIAADKQNADEHEMLQNWTMLIWSGKTKVSETFYVVVKNNRSFAVSYNLTIAGPDVTFPATTTVTPAQTAAVPAVTQPMMNRDTAGAPKSGTVVIAAGATQWYKFTYRYDNSKKDNVPTQALVVLKMNMPGAVSFTIETPGNLAAPRISHDGNLRGPIGAGAPLSLLVHNHDATTEEIAQAKLHADEHGMLQDQSLLMWAGSTRTNETFFVIVKNNQSVPVAYTLSITGPDVSFQ